MATAKVARRLGVGGEPETRDQEYWRTHPHPADSNEPECHLCHLCPGDPIHVNARAHPAVRDE